MSVHSFHYIHTYAPCASPDVRHFGYTVAHAVVHTEAATAQYWASLA